jgi:ComF family protein
MSNRANDLVNICLNFARRVGTQPCLLCGAPSRSGLVCAGCRRDLPYLPMNRCPVCALPTPNGEICGHCLRQPPKFDQAEAVFRYAYPIDSLIQALKYRGELAAARFLGESLARRLEGRAHADLIVPMPLHPARLRQRGFNQAAEIARHVAEKVGLPLSSRAVSRLREGRPQTELPLDERARNMVGAFSCDIELTGLRVALVDDVMTSGASLNELARVVRAAGATTVSAWVVARTLPKGQG